MTDDTNQTPPPKSAEIVPIRAPRPCPNCSKESTRAYYPFCSKRCADVDLNRWLSGRYAIPVADQGESDE